MDIFFTYYDYGHPLTLVLLHGFLGTQRDWDLYVPVLSKYYNIVVFDLPGHGASPISKTASLESVAQMILNRLYALAPDSDFVLVGYSMGGRLAQCLGFLDPSRIRFVFYISTRLDPLTRSNRLKRIKSDAARAKRISSDFPSFLHDWYRLPMFQSASFLTFKKERIDACLRQAPHHLARALQLFSPGISSSYRCSVPFSFICGEFDTAYVDQGLRVASDVFNDKVYVVKSSGHLCFFEKPMILLDIIQNTLFSLSFTQKT